MLPYKLSAKDGLAEEVENLKKDLEMERQRHSKTKNAAKEQKSKMDAEVETLKNTISQSVLQKRALQHQFEEAMQRIQRSEEEVKQLKIKQEQDAQERDAFCNKIEHLEKELSQSRSDLEASRSELDFEKEKTAKEKDRADQLESGAIIPTPVFHKVLNEFYASDAWYTTQRDLRITAGTYLPSISSISSFC